ncbi:GNAT family N-acetyltransferase [Rhizobium sp. L1K21]|uniref:GNAT family N-acetyltransferase n=1 Tax=Rhizobium sp. L1K21 TaxID=2954933 RepID=UPI0035932088
MLPDGWVGVYGMGWLAVSSDCRRFGMGAALVTATLKTFPPPSLIYVDTIADDTLDGRAAHHLYERSGFRPLSVVWDRAWSV